MIFENVSKYPQVTFSTIFHVFFMFSDFLYNDIDLKYVK